MECRRYTRAVLKSNNDEEAYSSWTSRRAVQTVSAPAAKAVCDIIKSFKCPLMPPVTAVV